MVRTVAPVFRVGRRTIGRDGSVYVIAEAGSNHDGRLEQARRLVDAAADAGADAVKFQLFHADRLYPRSSGGVSYLPGRSIYEVIQGLEMPEDWLPELKARAESRGLDFLCTPFDVESVATLEELGVVAYKVASYCLTHIPLLEAIAKTRKPVFLSTGLGDLGEVREALATLRKGGNRRLALLHCIASYPAPPEQMNLRFVRTLRDTFGVASGLSDHTLDPIVAPGASVALGGTVVEKHFTLDRGLEGPDHRYALEPDELTSLVRHVRAVASTLGSGVRRIEECERELYGFARTWIYTTRAIAKGERFAPENVAVLRSGKLKAGLHPRHLKRLLGRPSPRALPAYAPVTRDLL